MRFQRVSQTCKEVFHNRPSPVQQSDTLVWDLQLDQILMWNHVSWYLFFPTKYKTSFILKTLSGYSEKQLFYNKMLAGYLEVMTTTVAIPCSRKVKMASSLISNPSLLIYSILWAQGLHLLISPIQICPFFLLLVSWSQCSI